MKELDTTFFLSYGAKMNGYILIPEEMLKDLDNVSKYLTDPGKQLGRPGSLL